jgi:AAA family ATP:ADP antiporter
MPGEWRALTLSFAYFFFLLACYYVLRPVRDEMGIRSGVGNLPWLFTATFVVNLLIAPLYATLVAWLRRGVFIPLIYAFLILNMLAFWVLLNAGIAPVATAIAFFVWITVFSVFAVSIFWSFMADLFVSEQAKRLYPTIAAGGSLGGVAGGATVTGLVTTVGAANLLLIAAGLLALALACAAGLDKLFARGASARAEPVLKSDQKTAASWKSRLELILQPYLCGISAWVFLLSLAGTFAYFIQASIISGADLSSDERTQVFGFIDMTANILIPLIQLTIGRFVLQKLGVGITLGVVTAVFAVGFVALAASPVVSVLVAFMIAQRTGQFALSNPARESLFTVVGRDSKYMAKNVIDNVVFRGGDVANAWLYNFLNIAMGFGIPVIALVGAPIAALWLALSIALGRAQARLAEHQADEATQAAPSLRSTVTAAHRGA